MYGTRDAPQIWASEVAMALEGLGFERSVNQPSVYFHRVREIVVAIHVDDFLISGTVADLEWLYVALRVKYDLKRTLLTPGSTKEARYLNRRIRWVNDSIELEGDEKHAKVLLREWGLVECKPVDTPVTKSVAEKIHNGEPLEAEEATKIRRAVARVSYMAQDRPDLAVASRILSQSMANPHAGIRLGLKIVIQYLKKYPRCVLHVAPDPEMALELWTDSDWAGDVSTRRSCSGGLVLWHGVPLTAWSKMQNNIALSSGEAELNGAVKAVSEGIGASNLIHELCGEQCRVVLCTDASAWKGILLRQGWVQGAIEAHGITVQKVGREVNPADALIDPSCVSSRDGATHGNARLQLSVMHKPLHVAVSFGVGMAPAAFVAGGPPPTGNKVSPLLCGILGVCRRGSAVCPAPLGRGGVQEIPAS
jgi:hypothetical protein